MVEEEASPLVGLAIIYMQEVLDVVLSVELAISPVVHGTCYFTDIAFGICPYY